MEGVKRHIWTRKSGQFGSATDEALYDTKNHTVFFTLQMFPVQKVEVFVNGLYFKGDAVVSDVNLSNKSGFGPGAGLDFDMLSENIAGFSDLDVTRGVFGGGLNYSFNEAWVLTSLLEYNDYNDNAPYLFDATGDFLTFQLGVNWFF